MNIYLVERDGAACYDEYDSFVCVAPSAHAARHMHPSMDVKLTWDERQRGWQYETGLISSADNWVAPDNVIVTFLGKTKRTNAEVVCASYNAG